MSHYRHDEELGIAVVADPGDAQNDRVYWVDFRIYETNGWDDSEIAEFLAKGTIPELAMGQPISVYAHGSVKWDGCSNWMFDEQNSCMLHGCSRNDTLRFGKMLAACWDWAGPLMPNTWIGDA